MKISPHISRPQPKVAILDDFDLDPKGFPHGQAVESVLLDNSEVSAKDVVRFQNTPEQADLVQLMREEKLDFATAMTKMAVKNVANFYLGTALNLHKILQENPEVKIVNQSQGETPGRALDSIFEGLKSNEKAYFGALDSLGLDRQTSLAKLSETVLGMVEKAVNESELVKQAKEHHVRASKALYDKGVTYLVAGGNHGYLAQELKSLGAQLSNSVFKNVLVNEYVTVVGANDPQGERAALNSPGAANEVYRQGEEIEWKSAELGLKGKNEGTSFATPLAAGEAFSLLQDNPELSPFQIESKLMGLHSYRVDSGQTEETANGQELKADGKLEPYILEQIGEGFITDIGSPDAQQFTKADNLFIPLPGQEDHEFQFVKVKQNAEGERQLKIETYFAEGHHVITATAKDGSWSQDSLTEELHLDPKREAEIQARKPV